MKTQKVTKTSKFTQVTPNDNEYQNCQNIGWTVLPASPLDEGNQNLERINYPEGHCHNVNNSSELLLKSNYEAFKTQDVHELQRCSPERNANRYPPQTQPQDIELCNCITPIYQKTRFADQCGKGGHPQTMTLNRSFSSIPKMDTNLSLDRKTGKYMARSRGIFRVQSPEIINIHRGPFFEGHVLDGGICGVSDFKCKDHEFRRGHSVRAIGTRGGSILGIGGGSGQQKRRAAGDGMDAEMDDPELVFEMSSSAGGAPGAGHLGVGVGVGVECQCPCDHVVYSPTAYTACLQAADISGRPQVATVSLHDIDNGTPNTRFSSGSLPFVELILKSI